MLGPLYSYIVLPLVPIYVCMGTVVLYLSSLAVDRLSCPYLRVGTVVLCTCLAKPWTGCAVLLFLSSCGKGCPSLMYTCLVWERCLVLMYLSTFGTGVHCPVVKSSQLWSGGAFVLQLLLLHIAGLIRR